MKIGIVSFIDDNFGDMILRNCFTQLFRIVLKNLGKNDPVFLVTSVSEIDEQLLSQADLICFPGGAMFGRTEQAFAEPIERITNLAEEKHIPVIFSSIGMYESEENKAALARILNKSCVRAFSVREKADVFRQCANGSACEIIQVCDPGIWTGQVYRIASQHSDNQKPVVGINAVRGGLFSTYEGKWKLADEEAYLFALAEALDKAGYDYRFFANGQTLDCNVLLHFAEKYGVSKDKLICPDTSNELVRAIASFEAVAAIRMHASIISYALGVPSVNLVWNSKVKDFYDYIGKPERVVAPDENAAETTASRIYEAFSDRSVSPDPRLMMTLYTFLFNAVQSIWNADGIEMFDYEQVGAALQEISVPKEEDERDLRIKIRRGEVRYASLFNSDLSQKAKVRKLNREVKSGKTKSTSLKAELEEASQELFQTHKKLEATRKQLDKAQKELDYLNSRFVVKAYRRLAAKGQKLKKKS